ncbi:MAG: hypothetical protein HY053_04295 [Proteobacteria bacterium]|nr:hypothetical protein [Pseudomonadota bacterium]
MSNNLYAKVFKQPEIAAQLAARGQEGLLHLARFDEELKALLRQENFHIEFSTQLAPDSVVEPWQGHMLAPGILYDTSRNTLILGKDRGHATLDNTNYAALFRGVHLALFCGFLDLMQQRRRQQGERVSAGTALLIHASASLAAFEIMKSPKAAPALPPLMAAAQKLLAGHRSLLLGGIHPRYTRAVGLNEFQSNLEWECAAWLQALENEKKSSWPACEALDRLLNDHFDPEVIVDRSLTDGAGPKTTQYYKTLQDLARCRSGRKVAALDIELLRRFAGNRLRAASPPRTADPKPLAVAMPPLAHPSAIAASIVPLPAHAKNQGARAVTGNEAQVISLEIRPAHLGDRLRSTFAEPRSERLGFKLQGGEAEPAGETSPTRPVVTLNIRRKRASTITINNGSLGATIHRPFDRQP